MKLTLQPKLCGVSLRALGFHSVKNLFSAFPQSRLTDLCICLQLGMRLPKEVAMRLLPYVLEHPYRSYPRCFLKTASTWFLGTSPTILSTSLPFFIISMVGMLKIWKRSAVLGLSSTLSFPTRTFPVYSLASSSIVGAKARHGPHQGAQQSIKASEC